MRSPAPPTTTSPTASAAWRSSSCARATARPGSTSCRRAGSIRAPASAACRARCRAPSCAAGTRRTGCRSAIRGWASSAPRRRPTGSTGSPAISWSTTGSWRRRSGCSSAPASWRRPSIRPRPRACRQRTGRPSGSPRPSATTPWSTSAPACRGWPRSSGRPRRRHLGRVTGRLVGAQLYKETAALLGVEPAGRQAFGEFMVRLAAGEGDAATVAQEGDAVLVRRAGWRLMRGLEPLSPAVFEAWNGLLEGALAVHDRFLVLEVALPPRLGRRRLHLAHPPSEVALAALATPEDAGQQARRWFGCR